LKKNMLLQCDTTVIYALALEHRYRGTLTLKDLKFDSGYNTYVYPGLPPGPIMNPGYDSLLAAFPTRFDQISLLCPHHGPSPYIFGNAGCTQ
jgi:UPF0755 protein